MTASGAARGENRTHEFARLCGHASGTEQVQADMTAADIATHDQPRPFPHQVPVPRP